MDVPLQWIGFEQRPIAMYYENTGCDGKFHDLHTRFKLIQVAIFIAFNFQFQFHRFHQSE